MATPEAKVKKKVKELLKEFGVYYTMQVTGGFGNSGVPDIIACHRGRFYGIECKAGKNTPTLLQSFNLDSITKASGVAIVVHENNIEELRQLLISELGCNRS